MVKRRSRLSAIEHDGHEHHSLIGQRLQSIFNDDLGIS